MVNRDENGQIRRKHDPGAAREFTMSDEIIKRRLDP
jgi:hypothetical protein